MLLVSTKCLSEIYQASMICVFLHSLRWFLTDDTNPLSIITMKGEKKGRGELITLTKYISYTSGGPPPPPPPPRPKPRYTAADNCSFSLPYRSWVRQRTRRWRWPTGPRSRDLDRTSSRSSSHRPAKRYQIVLILRMHIASQARLLNGLKDACTSLSHC